MRLITLTDATGKDLLVNPAMIWTVMPFSEGGSVIRFSHERSVVVKEDLGMIRALANQIHA
jgi:uncharacterized protein YlzI (FlbEa/FlbD family)